MKMLELIGYSRYRYRVLQVDNEYRSTSKSVLLCVKWHTQEWLARAMACMHSTHNLLLLLLFHIQKDRLKHQLYFEYLVVKVQSRFVDFNTIRNCPHTKTKQNGGAGFLVSSFSFLFAFIKAQITMRNTSYVY